MVDMDLIGGSNEGGVTSFEYEDALSQSDAQAEESNALGFSAPDQPGADDEFTWQASKRMLPGILGAMFSPLTAFGVGAKVLNGLRNERTIGDAITDAMKEKGYSAEQISIARNNASKALEEAERTSGISSPGAPDGGSGLSIDSTVGEISSALGEELPTSLTSDGGAIDPNSILADMFSGGTSQSGDIPTGGTNPQIKIMQDQMMLTVESLTEISEIRDISYVTGGLSKSQEKILGSIETNQIQLLTDTINEQTADSFESSVAKLIDNGVLNGTIGQTTINKLYESAQKAVATGTTEILNSSLAQRLNMMEANADRMMQVNIANQQADIARAELDLKAKGLQLEGVGDIAKIGIYDQPSGGDFLNAAVKMRGQDLGLESSDADRALREEIAKMEKDAASDANKWGAAGEIGGELLKGWSPFT